MSDGKYDSSIHPVGDVVVDQDTKESLLDSSSDSEPDSSVDLDLEDETYVPEVLCRKTQKERKAHGKRGNNESSMVDREDIIINDYEHFNDKYQFALDLKDKDLQPSKIIVKYIGISNCIL